MLFTEAAQLAQSAKPQSANVLWAAATQQPVKTETKPNGNNKDSTPISRFSNVHFKVPEVKPEEEDNDEEDDDDEDDEEDDDENYEDYDYDQNESYYNEVNNL